MVRYLAVSAHGRRAGAVPVVGEAAPAADEEPAQAARVLEAGVPGRPRRPAAADRQPRRLRRARPHQGQLDRQHERAAGPLERRVPDAVRATASRSATCASTDFYGPPARQRADGDVTGSFECRQAVPSPCTGGERTGTLVQPRLRARDRHQPAREPVRRLRPEPRPDGAVATATAPQARRGWSAAATVIARSRRSAGSGAARGPATRRTTCTSHTTATDRE